MPGKTNAERLKKLAAKEGIDISHVDLSQPKPTKQMKRKAKKLAPQAKSLLAEAEKIRKCCGTPSGEFPHKPDCIAHLPKKWTINRKTGVSLPVGWRWPLGTTISKRWNGIEWVCFVEVPGIDNPFKGSHAGSFKAETRAMEVYLKQIEKAGIG